MVQNQSLYQLIFLSNFYIIETAYFIKNTGQIWKILTVGETAFIRAGFLFLSREIKRINLPGLVRMGSKGN